jgi:hypothetical protein
MMACASTNGSDTAGAMTPNSGDGASLGGAGNGFDVGNPGGTGAAVSSSLPPENKATIVVDVPKASQNYVYAANPDRDSVAIINPQTLSIQTVSVDAAPHGLQTIPGQDGALVANTGASTVSVIRTDKSGSTRVSTVPVMTGANVISIAPDGQHALAYYDSSQPTAGPATDSPKEVSALDLSQDSPVVYHLTVGYHPSIVNFSDDSKQAIVVTEDGISIVQLQTLNAAASRIISPIPIYDATTTKTANVTVTPDGLYAIAHQTDSSLLRLVDLAAKDSVDLDLASLYGLSIPDSGAATATIDVSDVQVSPDGTFLVAVVRDRQMVLRVPIPGGFESLGNIGHVSVPDVLTGAVSIGPDGRYAVLFTTVSATEQHVSILDMSGQYPLRTINLHKLVNGVTFDPTGTKAYVLHQPSTGDQTAQSYGYSVIDLASTASNLVLTATKPGPIAALPDGSALFILFTEVPWQVQRFNLLDLSFSTISIANEPTGIGFVESAKQIFVSQAQTDGRITFIDWTTLAFKSVAGYELNASIWE